MALTGFKRICAQLFPSPAAPLTEANLPSQAGKVIIVTGGSAGVGLELCRILYNKGAKVYMVARNEAKSLKAIEDIKSKSSSSAYAGSLDFLQADFNDLRTIKPCVDAFLAIESSLHVLINNAGCANVPASQVTAQGLEPHMGVNVVAGYLLTSLLTPTLASTASNPKTPANCVRVIFSSSMLVDALAPPEGVPLAELKTPSKDHDRNYAISKTANWFLATQLAKLLGPKNVIALTVNPGNLLTALFNDTPRWIVWMSMPVYYKAVDGAHTNLWAAFDASITVKDGGRYVIPWGKWHQQQRPEQLEALKDVSDGGRGYAKLLVDFCNEQSAAFR